MAKETFQDQLFQAIDIITEEKMRNLSYNYCIEGVITSGTQNADGSYNFQYQDNIYTAFSLSNTEIYHQGDVVYVMAISGDLSKKKVILTNRSYSGQKYIDVKKEIQDLNSTNYNYVTDTSDVLLKSGTSEKALPLASKIVQDSLVQTYIRISAVVTGALEATANADYGIEITFKYTDGTSKIFALTLNEITGNPFAPTGKHDTIEAISVDKAVESATARAYIKGFPAENTSDYIKFSKIRIEFVDDTLADISGKVTYKVEINSSNGMVFKNGIVSTVLSAKVYKGKDEITNSIPATRFTWTRASSNVDADNAWNSNHGKGVKTITVTQADVLERATFTCEVLEEQE